MTTPERWKRAQSAEREHESHSSMPSDMSKVQSYFLSQFDVDIQELVEDRVLEVGSGTGMIHTFPESAAAIGIDPLSSELSVSGSSAEVVTGVGEHLPFETGSIDRVICFNVLDHVLNPHATVAEMARVLREDGHLYLTVNVFRAPAMLRRVADHIDPPHPHHFSVSEVREVLRASGLSIDELHVTPHSVHHLKSVKSFVGKHVFRLRQLHVSATPAGARSE